jgi:hypothetical protein
LTAQIHRERVRRRPIKTNFRRRSATGTCRSIVRDRRRLGPAERDLLGRYVDAFERDS